MQCTAYNCTVDDHDTRVSLDSESLRKAHASKHAMSLGKR